MMNVIMFRTAILDFTHHFLKMRAAILLQKRAPNRVFLCYESVIRNIDMAGECMWRVGPVRGNMGI